jgi:hypothetical protein
MGPEVVGQSRGEAGGLGEEGGHLRISREQADKILGKASDILSVLDYRDRELRAREQGGGQEGGGGVEAAESQSRGEAPVAGGAEDGISEERQRGAAGGGGDDEDIVVVPLSEDRASPPSSPGGRPTTRTFRVQGAATHSSPWDTSSATPHSTSPPWEGIAVHRGEQPSSYTFSDPWPPPPPLPPTPTPLSAPSTAAAAAATSVAPQLIFDEQQHPMTLPDLKGRLLDVVYGTARGLGAGSDQVSLAQSAKRSTSSAKYWNGKMHQILWD